MNKILIGSIFGFTLISGIAQNSMLMANTAISDSLLISEVVVTGARSEVDLRHLPLSVSIVDNNQIEKRYEQSLLPVLTELVPGLFTTSRGVMGYGVSTGAAGGISMRGVGGSPTTGMLILIDSHPQYMGLMGHSIADAYQSMIAEKVEIVRGPSSMLYGSNAMGGVINILTKKQKNDGVNTNLKVGYGSYNTLTTEFSNRVRKNKFSSVITGSYNRSDGHRENMDFEQYGGYAKLGYDITENWNVFTDLSLTHFNASNPGTDINPIFDNDSQITRGVASVAIENNYELSSGAIKLFYNWGRHKIDDGFNEGGSPRDYLFNSTDKMYGINWYQGFNLFSGNRITFGFDYQNFGGHAWNAFNDGTNTDIIDKTEDNIAGYIDIRQNLASFITLNAGVRFDHHSVSGSHWIPQFGVSLYPLQTSEIKIIASRGFRNPTIREMYMFPPQNPDLKPESLWNYEFSFSQRLLDNKLSYSVNAFYIKGDNIIRVMPVNGRPLNVNTGDIENWGAELSASYQLSTAFSILTNYSWLHMETPVLAAPEHKFYCGVNYDSKWFGVSTGAQYIDGLYTSLSPVEQENFLLWNAILKVKPTKKIELYVKGENLLNKKYEINTGFPMPGTTVMGGINMNF